MGNKQGAEGTPVVHCRDISATQLLHFDGTGSKSSYVSLNNHVFDVTPDAANPKHKDRIAKNTDVDQQELEWYQKAESITFVGNLIALKEFTAQTLANFVGVESKENPDAKILLAAKGMVFDVTPGKSFYGPEGGYHKFAGKNCQRALALTSLKPEALENSDISDLTEKDLKTLDDWVTKYFEKYIHVGTLKP